MQTFSRPPCPHLSSTQHSRTHSFLERVSFHSLQDSLLSCLSSNCSSCSFSDSLAGSFSFAQPLISKFAEKSILSCFPFSVYTHRLGYLIWTCDLKHHGLSHSVVPDMDCSPPGSSVQGIFQARVLELAAILSSRGFS